jgi:hypothetical protein
MPSPMFEVASPFDDADQFEDMIDGLGDPDLDARSLEINARRAMVENAESLRLARSL